ncbi:MAG: type II secretion system protein [Leptospirillum sp.]|jgi:prepilin-type N-terminal cleavage/methylation domain-containing protein|nr:type II secretion system protein [Nitrospiraceae bacterium]
MEVMAETEVSASIGETGLSNVAKKTNDAGFTMIELSVVLLVIGILVAAALLGYNSFVNGGKIAATKTEIEKLIETAHNYAQANAGQVGGTYNGLTAYAAGGYVAGSTTMLPSSYTTQGVLNPYGGYGTIATGTNTNQFTLSETGLSTDGCTAILNAYSSHGTGTCAGGTLTLTMN